MATTAARDAAPAAREVDQMSAHRNRSLADQRECVEALLGLQVYSHRLYRQMQVTSAH